MLGGLFSGGSSTRAAVIPRDTSGAVRFNKGKRTGLYPRPFMLPRDYTNSCSTQDIGFLWDAVSVSVSNTDDDYDQRGLMAYAWFADGTVNHWNNNVVAVKVYGDPRDAISRGAVGTDWKEWATGTDVQRVIWGLPQAIATSEAGGFNQAVCMEAASTFTFEVPPMMNELKSGTGTAGVDAIRRISVNPEPFYLVVAWWIGTDVENPITLSGAANLDIDTMRRIPQTRMVKITPDSRRTRHFSTTLKIEDVLTTVRKYKEARDGVNESTTGVPQGVGLTWTYRALSATVDTLKGLSETDDSIIRWGVYGLFPPYWGTSDSAAAEDIDDVVYRWNMRVTKTQKWRFFGREEQTPTDN